MIIFLINVNLKKIKLIISKEQFSKLKSLTNVLLSSLFMDFRIFLKTAISKNATFNKFTSVYHIDTDIFSLK